MNNEIKEILEYVLSLTYGNENAIKGVNKVLDYITKLREDIRTGQEIIGELQQENERLKDIVVEKDSQIKEIILQKRDYTAVNILEMKLEDYKSRCEKAIELIKNDWYKLNTLDIEHCINLGKDIRIDLLNILQNGSDDNDI